MSRSASRQVGKEKRVRVSKDPKRTSRYWLLWHMSLGISKFLIYDNDDLHLRHDSLDEAQLRTVLDAFIREGYVELVSFSGPSHEGGQREAASLPHARRGKISLDARRGSAVQVPRVSQRGRPRQGRRRGLFGRDGHGRIFDALRRRLRHHAAQALS